MTGDGRRDALAWVGLVLVAVCGLLAGLLETLLTPFYLGGHVFPIAVPAAIVSNLVLPRMARTFVPTLFATALPFLAWLVVLIGFGVVTRPEGDVILPGGALQLVSYGVLLGGALTGIITVVVSAPVRPPPSRTTSRTT